ncbi:unnamed protein product [Protopolystoma xenopodis]|uniref:Kinesin motor domain-containing protein n=1 Tax=Protopolystoma xenopodis TaxID=117903 RepID=A0A3S4ZXU3_9PLAT|nr:unnamed protein product [Protopolystoma xenopodis]
MSMVEIYNETVVDLLSSTNQFETVDVRNSGHGFSIVGANWVGVKEEDDILSVSLLGTDRVSGALTRGNLTLCDLAGSERIEKSGATSGERLAEATSINLSLTSLASVS